MLQIEHLYQFHSYSKILRTLHLLNINFYLGINIYHAQKSAYIFFILTSHFPCNTYPI